MLDIKSNNKFSVVSIEKWEDYQISKEKMNSKLNNKRTTSEHKQECREIYITLFNKYKAQIESDFTKKTKIISKCKECSDYALLTREEQDNLFYDLMSVDIDKKIR